MRSIREGWFKTEPLKPEAQAVMERVIEERSALPAVRTSPSDVLLRLGNRSKLRLARTVDRTAGTLSKLKGPILLETTQALKNTVDAASKLHGWGQDSEGSKSLVNINLLGVDPGVL